MYSISDLGAMISDTVRMRAFTAALRRAVAPGCVVLDVGTGTGIFALLACQFGARRVYAIEPSDAIQIARETAGVNGYADRIEFIQALSTDVTLPERADVMVADIGGALPWFGHHLPAIADARRRHLTAGGVMIPERDCAWAAVVQAPDLYSAYEDPWTDNAFDLDLTPARRIAVNIWRKAEITADHLLTEPLRFGTLEYARVERSDIAASLAWTALRAGVAHGIGAGLDRTVAAGLRISNAPDAPADLHPQHIYPPLFFPFQEPVRIAAGDVVVADLDARLVGADYVWRWNTRVLAGGNPAAPRARFTQSTLLGTPLSPAQLRKQAAGYVPALSADGQVMRLVLEAMARCRSNGEIAMDLATRFPSRFSRWEDALGYVGDLSRQYG